MRRPAASLSPPAWRPKRSASRPEDVLSSRINATTAVSGDSGQPKSNAAPAASPANPRPQADGTKR